MVTVPARRIILWPTSIFSIYEDGWQQRLVLTEQVLVKRVLEVILTKKELSPWNKGLLLGYPRVCASLAKTARSHPEVEGAILEDSNCTLYYLLGDYDELADSCEEQLLGNGMGQFIYHIIHWAVMNKRELRKPMSYYQGHLLRDPYWALRTNLLLNSESFMEEVAAMSLTEKDQSAGAAFFHLLANPDEPVERYQHLFNEDPFYSVLGMHALYDRGFTARKINMAKVTPQWAYHLSLFDARIPEMECVERVLRSPEWTTEYITSRNFLTTNIAHAMDLYFRSVDGVKGDFGRPLDPQFHKWLLRVKKVHNLN